MIMFDKKMRDVLEGCAKLSFKCFLIKVHAKTEKAFEIFVHFHK